MKQIQTITVDGVPVLLEVSEFVETDGYGTETVGIREKIEDIGDIFDSTMNRVHAFAKGVVRHIKNFDDSITPDKFEVQFGVKLTAKGGVITEIGGEAQLVITLTYEHSSKTKRQR